MATIAGTVAVALFINFVRNGLNLMGVNPFWVQVVTWIILLLAVLMNTVVNLKGEPMGERHPRRRTRAGAVVAMSTPLIEMRDISKTFGPLYRFGTRRSPSTPPRSSAWSATTPQASPR